VEWLDALAGSFSILPLFVFLAEVTVVTLSTIRTIFIARGMKYLAPLLGLFEVSIWLFAISQVMSNLNNPWCFAAFAAGFTMGNFLGIHIEKRLAIGNLVVNVISHKDAGALVESLKQAEYGVTSVDAQGAMGPVRVVTTVIRRKELTNVLSLVKRFDERAFYSVNELQAASVDAPGRRVLDLVGQAAGLGPASGRSRRWPVT
jgi:uncharacterized protein YebE (UPF0316 family)